MKKPLSILLLIFICFACEDNSSLIFVPRDPGAGGIYTGGIHGSTTTKSSVNLSSYASLASNIVEHSLNESQNYLSQSEGKAYYNYEALVRDEITTLNVDFKIPDLDISYFSKIVAFNFVNQRYDGVKFDIAAQYPKWSAYLNSTQVIWLNTYFNNMYNAYDAASAQDYYVITKTNVNNASLTNDQKIMVIGILEYANQFALSYFNGDTKYILIDIQNATSQAAGNCKINWKDVWRSAVGSGLTNGVRGAIIGGTTGTFTVPILGTASGAVGGGVFGFAAGFIGGAGGAMVYQGFWNCLMDSPVQTETPDKCLDPEYAKWNMETCFQPAFDNKLIFILK